MTVRIRKYFASLLDVYVLGSIVLLSGKLIDKVVGTNLTDDYVFYLFGILWSVVLMKDVTNGQSIFKKLLGLKVVDKRSGNPIKSIVSILRNFVALPIFPIELIIYIIFKRRIGDLIFSTEVIETEKVKMNSVITQLGKHSRLDYIKYFAISFLLAVIGLIPYTNFLFGLI